jgi:hypothetical protein
MSVYDVNSVSKRFSAPQGERIPEDEIIRLVREGTVPVQGVDGAPIGQSGRRGNRLEPNREALSVDETDIARLPVIEISRSE